MQLKQLVRPNIWGLTPYSSARSEFKGEASVWLDANENPNNAPYNRYPDPLQLQLKARLAQLKGVPAANIFLGNGSDECIDLAYRIFCRPGIDNAVAISPSYGMYEVCADINGVDYRPVPLTDDFALQPDLLLAACDANTRLMWLCSPNNPTGNAFSPDQLEWLCRRFDGIVVVDEAYIDFSTRGTMLTRLSKLPRLIVLQTFSKAWGSAGVRLGIAVASEDIIALYNKVKYPYNVNVLTQRYAMQLLDDHTRIQAWVEALLEQRQRLVAELQALPLVRHIYPSDANFVLVRVADADATYNHLRSRGIIVRNRNRVSKCLGCLRITVGTADENTTLINALQQYGNQ